MARCSCRIVAINVGPGEQPEDVFVDIPEEVLEMLVATQMPKDAPTANLFLGFGRTFNFCLGEGGVWVWRFIFDYFFAELFFATGWWMRPLLQFGFNLELGVHLAFSSCLLFWAYSRSEFNQRL